VDILCIKCADQVILYTIYFVTGNFVIAFKFYIWRYFTCTLRRGSFRGRSRWWTNLPVSPPKGPGLEFPSGSEAAARRRASWRRRPVLLPVGRPTERGWGLLGQPKGAGLSAAAGTPDQEGGSGREPSFPAKRAPEGTIPPGTARPGRWEAKPFGATAPGAGAATGSRAARRPRARFLLGGTARGETKRAAAGEAAVSRGSDSVRGESARRWAADLEVGRTGLRPLFGFFAGPARGKRGAVRRARGCQGLDRLLGRQECLVRARSAGPPPALLTPR